jgi:hypothetical protein
MNQKPEQTRTPETVARKLLNVIMYDNCCRSGDAVEFDKLIEMSEIGTGSYLALRRPVLMQKPKVGWSSRETT